MAVRILSRTKQLATQGAAGVLILGSEFNDFQSVDEGLSDASGGPSEGEEFEAIVIYEDAAYSRTWTRAIYQLDSGELIRQSTSRTKVEGVSATTADHDFDSGKNLIVYGALSHINFEEQIVLAIAASVFYYAPDFRLDDNDQGEIKVVNGQTVHELAVGETMHFGDGYLELLALREMNLAVYLQMSTSEASKNIKIITRIYDSGNVLIRTGTFDDISVPDNTSQAVINLTTVINDTDIATADEGRFEIDVESATTSAHTGQVQFKKIEIQYV